MGPSVTALLGFAGWFLVLTILMGVVRTVAAQTGKVEPNKFTPDGSELPGFPQRLTRARNNCYENLPAFAAIILAASIMGRLDVTDGLAMWFLYARFGQSVTHMISVDVPAVMVRFGFYTVQTLIELYWIYQLI